MANASGGSVLRGLPLLNLPWAVCSWVRRLWRQATRDSGCVARCRGVNFESGEEGWFGRGVRGGGSPSCLRCGVRRVDSGSGAVALVLGYVGEKTSGVGSPVASGPWVQSAGVVCL
jgi:hypothetical protein